jgi:hypothetical protein
MKSVGYKIYKLIKYFNKRTELEEYSEIVYYSYENAEQVLSEISDNNEYIILKIYK